MIYDQGFGRNVVCSKVFTDWYFAVTGCVVAAFYLVNRLWLSLFFCSRLDVEDVWIVVTSSKWETFAGSVRVYLDVEVVAFFNVYFYAVWMGLTWAESGEEVWLEFDFSTYDSFVQAFRGVRFKLPA